MFNDEMNELTEGDIFYYHENDNVIIIKCEDQEIISGLLKHYI